MAITAAQLRAARALINMTQDDLATAAEVATKTIATFEAEGRAPRGATVEKLQAALESVGVVFIETDNGAGVILRE
ncbi:helix-turn-helix transcriptional regulator [Devosia sp. LjRoot16]|uniref:helix-turn-helix domain-containing protein n=1 Tax=Devosia sp. LjRoot16 TaxID=3342271 RepID=UPI003ECDDF49